MTQYQCLLFDGCVFVMEQTKYYTLNVLTSIKNYQDEVKLQDFVVLFTYTVQTFTFYLLLKCNVQTLAAILHIL